jgi:hypothetical protein
MEKTDAASYPGAALSQNKSSIIQRWLESQRSGWKNNLATPPTGGSTISLKTPSGRIELTFFPGPDYPDWRHSVILKKERSVKIASFPESDLKPLFDLIA